MTRLRSLTLMPMMIWFKLAENSSHCWIFTWINPTLWGILKCKVRLFFMYSSQSWIFKIFRASDDTIEIFDIDANDDLVHACRKFLTMLDFYLDKSNIVRNFSKTFQILQCEEFLNEKSDCFSLIPHKVGFLTFLKLLLTPLISLTWMSVMI